MITSVSSLAVAGCRQIAGSILHEVKVEIPKGWRDLVPSLEDILLLICLTEALLLYLFSCFLHNLSIHTYRQTTATEMSAMITPCLDCYGSRPPLADILWKGSRMGLCGPSIPPRLGIAHCK